MSVALVWVVSPNIKVLNCFGVLDSLSFAFGKGRAKMGRKQQWNSGCLSRSSSTEVKCSSTFGLRSETEFPNFSTMVANPAGELVLSSEQKVDDVVLMQAALVKKQLRTSGYDVDVKPDIVLPGNNKSMLSEAYDRCREVCAEYAKTFDLGTLLMTPERRRAIWEIYVWCRRTDELVDGPDASHITPQTLDRMSSHKVFDIDVNRRIGAIAALSLALLAKDSISTKLADGFDFQLVAPDQTIEEAESGIVGHAQALLQVKQLIMSESWGQLQTAVRKSSPLLKQDIYTIIQQKPGNERPLLRKLYSNLFNNVTRLDYAARDRDPSRIRECYENIVVILNDVLSRL